MKSENGRVIKAVASKFFVATDNAVRVCFARKKLKQQGDIFVGDRVLIARERDSFVIEETLPRANVLIRPYVSNIDICLILVACVPEPDLVLVDKIIVNCLHEKILPVIVCNKTDMGRVPLGEYAGVTQVLYCSAASGEGVDALAELIKGRTVCFAGQSAVGKSSLINALMGSDRLEVGELAKKIKRGRHTTRVTEIIPCGEETYLADTCGFSMLETVDIPSKELRFYFDDMEVYRKECRFNSCLHLDEPGCAVKPHVGTEIGQGRYERYKIILNELNERRKNKYD